MNPASVTAVVLTRDEERNLPRALTSLPRGMPVFVLDAGSSDHTVVFARGSGATVEIREWTDFVDARRYALARVGTPWTLMIDADEALDDVLLQSVLDAPEDCDGYVVRRTTYFCGKPMRLWTREPLLRLFRTQRARLESKPAAGGAALLHERWVCDGDVRELAGTLLHFSYPDVSSYRTKYDRYTSIEAAGLRRDPLRWLAAVATGAARFFWLALAKGAVLDGPRGLYVAYHSAMYPAVVARKAFVG